MKRPGGDVRRAFFFEGGERVLIRRAAAAYQERFSQRTPDQALPSWIEPSPVTLL